MKEHTGLIKVHIDPPSSPAWNLARYQTRTVRDTALWRVQRLIDERVAASDADTKAADSSAKRAVESPKQPAERPAKAARTAGALPLHGGSELAVLSAACTSLHDIGTL